MLRINGCVQTLAAALFILSPAMAGSASAQDADATYKEIQGALGGVPGFVKMYPKGSVAGVWALTRDLQFSDKTALDAKQKALISLAVAAQIPCTYCVWSDTRDAKAAGASDDEIAEAVAIAGLTRHWSTFFNGMQIDLNTFKKELGGDVAAN